MPSQGVITNPVPRALLSRLPERLGACVVLLTLHNFNQGEFPRAQPIVSEDLLPLSGSSSIYCWLTLWVFSVGNFYQ